MQNTIFGERAVSQYEVDSGRLKQEDKSTERLPKADRVAISNRNETTAATVDPKTE